MKVDSNIINAMEAYFKETNTGCLEFANEIDVSPAAVTKWRKVGSGITRQKWEKVFPLLKKYLPKDRLYIDDAGIEQYSSNTEHVSSYVLEPKYIPIMIPEFELNQLSEYDNILDSITQLAIRKDAKMIEYNPKHKDKAGVFSLVLKDSCYLPLLPANTRLFVCTSEPPTNTGLSIILPINGEPFIGHYHKTNDSFCITNLATNEELKGNIKNARNIITWVFPVLYYEVITF